MWFVSSLHPLPQEPLELGSKYPELCCTFIVSPNSWSQISAKHFQKNNVCNVFVFGGPAPASAAPGATFKTKQRPLTNS